MKHFFKAHFAPQRICFLVRQNFREENLRTTPNLWTNCDDDSGHCNTPGPDDLVEDFELSEAHAAQQQATKPSFRVRFRVLIGLRAVLCEVNAPPEQGPRARSREVYFEVFDADRFRGTIRIPFSYCPKTGVGPSPDVPLCETAVKL